MHPEGAWMEKKMFLHKTVCRIKELARSIQFLMKDHKELNHMAVVPLINQVRTQSLWPFIALHFFTWDLYFQSV